MCEPFWTQGKHTPNKQGPRGVNSAIGKFIRNDHTYSVFEHWRERAAVTLFLAMSLERNTLPLTGASGWWEVAGGWWLVGWLLVAGYGSLVSTNKVAQ